MSLQAFSSKHSPPAHIFLSHFQKPSFSSSFTASDRIVYADKEFDKTTLAVTFPSIITAYFYPPCPQINQYNELLCNVTSFLPELAKGLKSIDMIGGDSKYQRREQEWDIITKAVKMKNFKILAKYLQTAGLEDIQIPTEFKGNTSPTRKACLFVMAGYEPNRVHGLVDDYAPHAIVVFYGKSPHERLQGRQRLSIDLHKHIFDGWRYRERADISTLEVGDILNVLEDEYQTLRLKYDIAVASQCSKMQTVASYLFWKRHPEIQLIFTTAVKIEPRRYSKGEGDIFLYEMS